VASGRGRSALSISLATSSGCCRTSHAGNRSVRYPAICKSLSRSMSSQRCSGSSVCCAPSISTTSLSSSHKTSIQRRRPRESRRGTWRLGSGSRQARTTCRVKSNSDSASALPAISPGVLVMRARRFSVSTRSAIRRRSSTRTSRCWTPAASIAIAPRSVGIQEAASMRDRAIPVRLGCRNGCTSRSVRVRE